MAARLYPVVATGKALVSGKSLPPLREGINGDNLPVFTVVIPISFERDETTGVAPVEYNGRVFTSGDLYLDAQGKDHAALVRSLSYVMRRLTELKSNPVVRLGLVPGGKVIDTKSGVPVIKETKDRWELLDTGVMTVDDSLAQLAERLRMLVPDDGVTV